MLPYLAIRCLSEAGHRWEQQYPISAKAIKDNFYVDDNFYVNDDGSRNIGGIENYIR